MHVSVSILAWCMGCILTLKVSYFPSSASVFESLGDPCLKAWFSEPNSWILNYFIVLEMERIGLSVFNQMTSGHVTRSHRQPNN